MMQYRVCLFWSNRSGFRTGLANYPFVDTKPKAVWSFVIHQIKTGIPNRPNHTRVWFVRFGMSEYMFIWNKNCGHRTFSWNPLYKNKWLSQRKLLLVIQNGLDNYRSFRQYRIHSQWILITVNVMVTKFVPNYAFVVMYETGFKPKP